MSRYYQCGYYMLTLLMPELPSQSTFLCSHLLVPEPPVQSTFFSWPQFSFFWKRKERQDHTTCCCLLYESLVWTLTVCYKKNEFLRRQQTDLVDFCIVQLQSKLTPQVTTHPQAFAYRLCIQSLFFFNSG